MPHLATDDGVKLYYEDTGSGTPVVFVHEFAGDYRSWEPQVRYLVAPLPLHRLQRARLAALRGAAGGGALFAGARLRRHPLRSSTHSKIDKAHIVGLSMGGFATLHFGLTYPDRARSVLVAGAGYGSERGEREKFRNEAVVIAGKLEKEGMETFAAGLRLRADPRAVREQGPARLCRVQGAAGRALRQGRRQHAARRPARAPLDLRPRGQARRLQGADAGRHRRRGLAVPAARRVHQAHLPDGRAARDPQHAATPSTSRSPAAFNAALADFLAQVDAGRWPMRDPRAVSQSITGMTK